VQVRRAAPGIAFVAALLLCSTASAAVDVTMADLRAAARSLGFLQNIAHNNGLTIGVVYVPGSAEGRFLAQQTAERLRTLAGPRDTSLKAEIIAINDLANYPGQLDALFLLPGITGGAVGVMDVARRKRLLVMSNDPACLDQRFCMLMARDSGRAEIVLDSALAQSAGITFSSIFAMMVKRR
jgi:hypothetical protein